MQDVVCLYHGGGYTDGWASAWLVKKAFPNAKLIPVKYGDKLPYFDELDGKDVMIVDFSYPPEQMAELASVAKSIVMLDHHASAIEKWNGQYLKADIPWKFVFDITKSGAMLTWEYLQANVNTQPFWGSGPDNEPEACESPWLVRYVQDRDLWKWEIPDSHAVSAYIRCQPQAIETWDELYQTLEFISGRREVAAAGNLILSREKQIVDKAVNSAVVMKIGGFLVPVVNATEMTSEIGHALCKGKPFAAMYFDDLRRGVRVWSLRSEEGGEDVSKIAERFGGGGHKHAAGYTLSLMI